MNMATTAGRSCRAILPVTTWQATKPTTRLTLNPKSLECSVQRLKDHLFARSPGSGSDSPTRPFVVDQRVNLLPYAGIVLNLMVRPAQNANQPGIVIAIDAVILVSHLDISKDTCVIGISRMNCGPPVQQAFRLVEVNRTIDVGRNARAGLPNLWNAVYWVVSRTRIPSPSNCRANVTACEPPQLCP